MKQIRLMLSFTSNFLTSAIAQNIQLLPSSLISQSLCSSDSCFLIGFPLSQSLQVENFHQDNKVFPFT